ncbi:MAG: TonB family protein [Bryobacterales bacterium]|nr:TonB family protein [Bryobacterales bacterium]
MFEQTFVEGTVKTKTPFTVMASFIFQCILVGVAILIPLIYTDTLPTAQLTSFLVAPPPPPPPPPPPEAAPVVKAVRVIPRQFDAGRLMAPKSIPKEIAMIQEDELPPPTPATGVVGGVVGGFGGGVIGGIIGSVPMAAPPPPPEVKAAPKSLVPQRIPVGGNVQQAKLVNQPKPQYPPLARQARIQGTVRFTAIIGVDGRIQNLTLVSGHPLLVPAAQAAVKEWVYQPTLLNGEPVEVVTQIDVNFTLQ